MLNVSNIYKAFFILFISVSVNATDVSNFDIDGLQMNSHIKKIKQQMSTSSIYNPKKIKNYYLEINNKKYTNIISWSKYRYNGRSIDFNALGNITEFTRETKFKGAVPSFQTIIDKTTKKYGVYHSIYDIHVNNGQWKAICYGDCTNKKTDILSWDCKDGGTCLRVNLVRYSNSPSTYLIIDYINGSNIKQSKSYLNKIKKEEIKKAEKNFSL